MHGYLSLSFLSFFSFSPHRLRRRRVVVVVVVQNSVLARSLAGLREIKTMTRALRYPVFLSFLPSFHSIIPEPTRNPIITKSHPPPPSTPPSSTRLTRVSIPAHVLHKLASEEFLRIPRWFHRIAILLRRCRRGAFFVVVSVVVVVAEKTMLMMLEEEAEEDGDGKRNRLENMIGWVGKGVDSRSL